MAERVTLREAVPEEYEELGRLTVDAYEEFAQRLGEDWAGYRDDLADVARRAAQGTQLLAEAGVRPLGTVTYYSPRSAADPEDWWRCPRDHAYLRALAVHPGVRDQSIGKALTLATIQRATADGAAGIALNTMSFMAAATALYEGLGFRRTGGEVMWGDHGMLSYVLAIDGPRPSTLLESQL